MKPEITPRILSYITKEISNGAPLWGLFRANEYLASEDPIRKALAAKASETVPRQLGESEMFRLAANGKTLSELPPHLQAKIRGLREPRLISQKGGVAPALLTKHRLHNHFRHTSSRETLRRANIR